MIIFCVVLVTAIGVYWMLNRGNKYGGKLPPLSPASMWKIMTGAGIDRLTHFHDMSKWCQKNHSSESSSGTTFRISAPMFGIGSNTIVCCDYKLARVVLSGNASDTIKECEKTSLIQSLNVFDNVCSLLT
jgi:hypothetical protein